MVLSKEDKEYTHEPSIRFVARLKMIGDGVLGTMKTMIYQNRKRQNKNDDRYLDKILHSRSECRKFKLKSYMRY